MFWRWPFCLFDRHRPKPAGVRWGGAFHFGQCRDCGRMVRKSSKGYWKRLTTPVPTTED
jgi:hypothetical protein